CWRMLFNLNIDAELLLNCFGQVWVLENKGVVALAPKDIHDVLNSVDHFSRFNVGKRLCCKLGSLLEQDFFEQLVLFVESKYAERTLYQRRPHKLSLSIN